MKIVGTAQQWYKVSKQRNHICLGVLSAKGEVLSEKEMRSMWRCGGVRVNEAAVLQQRGCVEQQIGYLLHTQLALSFLNTTSSHESTHLAGCNMHCTYTHEDSLKVGHYVGQCSG